jgi:hypothetical protein
MGCGAAGYVGEVLGLIIRIVGGVENPIAPLELVAPETIAT